MKNTDFDYKRIAQGYKNRPFLHKQVIEQFQNDIAGILKRNDLED